MVSSRPAATRRASSVCIQPCQCTWLCNFVPMRKLFPAIWSPTASSHEVTEIIAGSAPLFEKSSIDEFYIDASGMDRYFGAFKWAVELRRKIMRESGLPISLGMSVNKLVSKVTTNEFKPNAEQQIPAGTEQDFLAPLSVENSHDR